LEVLLLKRTPRSGFIPGAWVFPGGRVDPDDSSSATLERLDGLSEPQAQARLTPEDGEPPALAYWVAAIRETFEETGVLPGVPPDRTSPSFLKGGWERLMAGQDAFSHLLLEAGIRLNVRNLRYIGHWLTPECEPRRYQTRFFLTQVDRGREVRPHEAEMVDHLWLTPAQALQRNRAGALPMVLPTLFTLEELAQYDSPAEALEGLGEAQVPRRLPVPERVDSGIRFRIPG
jgi:8-oxo-dGTP pyrophosphatase MutT (NUDIX family)